MNETNNPTLTAGDLMSRDVEMLNVNLSLREAAVQLARREVHAAPVVDEVGRCVGVLSVTDIARWVAGRGTSRVQLPRTCSFQEKHREPGGKETTLCCLAEGVCPFQRLREMPDGKLALACIEPQSVPVDWQLVEWESLPGDSVRDFMTTTVITTEPTTTVPELARFMLDQQVHSLIVLDTERHPIGVLTVSDLLQVLAHPELTTTGES